VDLIAVSYYNIWPFKDKNLNIFFDKGKFLIQAPIGSGKSFLFFDWPTYALYKNTGRNVLNVDSKTGFIKLLFEIDGQRYLIVRNLSEGKSKDVCKSQLLIVNWEVIIENKDWKDIEELLKESGSNLEEISFKNERDLDGNLAEILPPREVFLSTVFLLQDSENVFELQPADRLIVMKNIFNLVGIDEIKEQIANKRRDIQTTLKIKSDTSNYDIKIKNILREYINNYKYIENAFGEKNIPPTPLAEGVPYKEFVDELEMVADKVNINEFGMEWFDKNLNIEINNYIWIQKNNYQEFFVRLQNTQEQIKNKNENLRNLRNEVVDFEKKLEYFDNKLAGIKPEIIENKKKEKLSLISESDKLLEWISLDINIPSILSDILNSKPWNIEELNQLINDIIAKWQNLADQKTNLKLRIENLEVRIENENKRIEIELKNLNENKVNLENQLKNIVSRIHDLDKTINEESQFECVKINSHCPFVKDINKKTFEELEKQKKNFEEEKIQIESRIKIEDWKIKNINPSNSLYLGSEWQVEIKREIEKLNLECLKIDEQILAFRKFLADIDFKKIKETYQDWKNFQDNIGILDKEILQLELWQKELDNIKEEKIKILQQLEGNKKEINKIEKELEDFVGLENKQNEELKSFDISKIQELEKINKNMENNIRDLEILVNDFKWSQLELSKLKEEEKMVKNLYSIFSKELLLFVLEWYLPILTDIINSFLAQVVEYTIDIKLLQKNDNLEMDVRVYDEKWERDIKSLSGWQKVILKLVWMLAISSYMKSPILFLDETINNLDSDTVGKVADMLSDFVKQRDLKLYTVTHSQQIQEMDIWDKIIQIEDFT
jgi:DNA repair exonuclease SbcCD ATPase subunit